MNNLTIPRYFNKIKDMDKTILTSMIKLQSHRGMMAMIVNFSKTTFWKVLKTGRSHLFLEIQT